jgi:WD40 repeat protein
MIQSSHHPLAQLANPYVGPRTFAYEQRRLFFGREREARDLLARVLSERLLLFYSQSGAGKSSLLRTRLIPQLQEEKDFVVLPVGRVSGELPEGVGQVDNIFVFNLLLSMDEGSGPARLAHVTLGDFLAKLSRQKVLAPEGRERRSWVYDASVTPVTAVTDSRRYALILDQFEEIVTSHPGRWREREEFFRQLDEAMRADPNLWVVLTLREDYVAALDPYSPLVADRLRARFYMERMGVDAALDAIRKPAEIAGRPFEPDVAEKLVEELRQVRVAGQESTVPGQYVEPVQLQVVCYQLWEGLGERGEERGSGEDDGGEGQWITFADLDRSGDVDRALTLFYEETLAAALAEPAVAGVSERQLRAWFDRELITDAGARGLVHQGESETSGLPNDAVAALQKRFLVRAEVRGGNPWIELVHDRFVEPILASNAMWFPTHLSALQRQATLWNEQGRSSGLLLRDAALAEAEAWAAAQTDALEPHEEDFLTACREARSTAEREQRQSRVIRRLAIVAAVVAILALIAAVYARNQTEVARTAQRNAEQQEEIAEAQSQLARSRELAASALSSLTVDPELGILLGQQALAITYTLEAETALRQALQASRVVGRFAASDSSGLQAMAIAPDGMFVAASDDAGRLFLWLLSPKQHTQPVYETLISEPGPIIYDLAFAPAGNRLALARADGTVCEWELGKNQCTVVIQAHSHAVVAIAYDLTGELLVTAGIQDRVVRIWAKGSSAEPIQELFGHRIGVYDVAFSPDGQTVATAGRDATVRIWEIETGDELFTLTDHTDEVAAVAYSADGKWLASGGLDKSVILWRLVAGGAEKERVFYDSTNSISSLSFSPNSNCLASASLDRVGRVWNLGATEPAIALPGHNDRIFKIDMLPQANPIEIYLSDPCQTDAVTVGRDGTVRRWRLGPTVEAMTIAGHREAVESATFSPDGRLIASGSDDGTVRIWNAQDGVPLYELNEHADRVNRVAFSPAGDELATASWDSTVVLWNFRTGTVRQTFDDHVGRVHAIAFSDDGTMLASGSDDKTAIVYRFEADALTTAFMVDSFDHGSTVYDVAFTPDGGALATAGADGAIKIWSLETAALMHTLWHSDDQANVTAVYDIDFDHLGNLLGAAGWDASATIWEWNTGKKIARLNGHNDRLLAVEFSPNGQIVATSSADRTLRVWDWATGAVVRKLFGPEFNGFGFHPAGDLLVVGGEDGTVRIYLLDVDDLRKTAQIRTTRTLSEDECLTYLHVDVCPEWDYLFTQNDKEE